MTSNPSKWVPLKASSCPMKTFTLRSCKDPLDNVHLAGPDLSPCLNSTHSIPHTADGGSFPNQIMSQRPPGAGWLRFELQCTLFPPPNHTEAVYFQANLEPAPAPPVPSSKELKERAHCFYSDGVFPGVPGGVGGCLQVSMTLPLSV